MSASSLDGKLREVTADRWQDRDLSPGVFTRCLSFICGRVQHVCDLTNPVRKALSSPSFSLDSGLRGGTRLSAGGSAGLTVVLHCFQGRVGTARPSDPKQRPSTSLEGKM